MDKVIQCLFFQWISLWPLFVSGRPGYISLQRIGISGVISPTALKDYGTVIGCILNSSHLIHHLYLGITIENLTGHNPHSRFGSISSGNAADSYTIMIHGSYRSRHMSAVTSIFGCLPTDDPAIFYEVVTITVTLITILVRIIVRTQYLAFVHPHISLQIRMLPHNTFVKHGNNDFRITRTQFPRFFTINVGPHNSRSFLSYKAIISSVYISPLMR